MNAARAAKRAIACLRLSVSWTALPTEHVAKGLEPFKGSKFWLRQPQGAVANTPSQPCQTQGQCRISTAPDNPKAHTCRAQLAVLPRAHHNTAK